jgi:hypothetical protein
MRNFLKILDTSMLEVCLFLISLVLIKFTKNSIVVCVVILILGSIALYFRYHSMQEEIKNGRHSQAYVFNRYLNLILGIILTIVLMALLVYKFL